METARIFYIFFGIIATVIVLVFLTMLLRVCVGPCRGYSRGMPVETWNPYKPNPVQIRHNIYPQSPGYVPPSQQTVQIYQAGVPMGSEAIVHHSMVHTGPNIGFSEHVVSSSNFNQSYPQNEKNWKEDVASYKY